MCGTTRTGAGRGEGGYPLGQGAMPPDRYAAEADGKCHAAGAGETGAPPSRGQGASAPSNGCLSDQPQPVRIVSPSCSVTTKG